VLPLLGPGEMEPGSSGRFVRWRVVQEHKTLKTVFMQEMAVAGRVLRLKTGVVRWKVWSNPIFVFFLCLLTPLHTRIQILLNLFSSFNQTIKPWCRGWIGRGVLCLVAAPDAGFRPRNSFGLATSKPLKLRVDVGIVFIIRPQRGIQKVVY